jgi:hypothetical protein
VKSKLIAMGSLIVVAAALAVYAAAVPAAPARHISCTILSAIQIEPGSTTVDPTATKGHDAGNVTCGPPLGRGVNVGRFTIAPQTSTTGTATSHWKFFFNTGTVHGTVKVRYTATSATQITYTGTGPIVGGTGTLSNAAGTSKVRCSSNDGGIHTLCNVKFNLR